nr:MAG TPA: hypothetical protein [Caudoviricetes sp.]
MAARIAALGCGLTKSAPEGRFVKCFPQLRGIQGLTNFLFPKISSAFFSFI